MVNSSLPEVFLLWQESSIEDEFSLWRSFKHHQADLDRFSGVFMEKFPNSKLLPFAFIHDLSGHYNDGWPVVASFDLLDANKVRIYDFSDPNSSPWVNLAYNSFEDWIAMAEEENSQYKSELEEANLPDC